MDILSHGLYGGIAFGRKTRRDYITAFLFGIGPDLLAFGPFFLSAFLGFVPFPFGKMEPPAAHMVPEYVHNIYDVTHSLVVYFVFFAILWYFGKKSFAKLTFGWPLHILLDMPLHSNEFFPTPFFWPISHVHLDGIPWSNPYIFIPNVVLIFVLYAKWYMNNKKIKK